MHFHTKMEAGSSWRVRIAAPHIPHVPYVFTYSIIKVHTPTCVGRQKTLRLFWIKSFLDLPAQKAHKHSPSAMNGSVKIMCFSGMASLQFQFIGAVFMYDLQQDFLLRSLCLSIYFTQGF